MKYQAQRIVGIEEGGSNWILHFEDGTVTGIDRRAPKPPKGDAELFTLDGEESLVVALNVNGERVFDRVHELEGAIRSWHDRCAAAEAELKQLQQRYGPLLPLADRISSSVIAMRRRVESTRKTVSSIARVFFPERADG